LCALRFRTPPNGGRRAFSADFGSRLLFALFRFGRVCCAAGIHNEKADENQNGFVVDIPHENA
jgi:hypothetical protein